MVTAFLFIMPLNKEQKKQIIEDLKDKIDKQKSGVFVSIAGLKAGDLFDLRNKLKQNNCLLTVAKKTLLKIAFEGKKLDVDVKKLKGEVALVIGLSDEISGPKIVNQFAQSNKNLEILGGIFENGFIEKEKVVELAMIPSREELLARFVGSISSPISSFANVLQGNIKGLLYILTKIKT